MCVLCCVLCVCVVCAWLCCMCCSCVCAVCVACVCVANMIMSSGGCSAVLCCAAASQPHQHPPIWYRYDTPSPPPRLRASAVRACTLRSCWRMVLVGVGVFPPNVKMPCHAMSCRPWAWETSCLSQEANRTVGCQAARSTVGCLRMPCINL